MCEFDPARCDCHEWAQPASNIGAAKELLNSLRDDPRKDATVTTTVNEPAGYDPRDWYSLDEVNAYRDGYNDAEEKFTAERTTPTDHEPGVVADELQAAMPGMPVADYATVPMVTLLRVLNTLRALAAERAIGAEVLDVQNVADLLSDYEGGAIDWVDVTHGLGIEYGPDGRYRLTRERSGPQPREAHLPGCRMTAFLEGGHERCQCWCHEEGLDLTRERNGQ